MMRVLVVNCIYLLISACSCAQLISKKIISGKRPQFYLLEKKIGRTETDMALSDWLLFTYKC